MRISVSLHLYTINDLLKKRISSIVESKRFILKNSFVLYQSHLSHPVSLLSVVTCHNIKLSAKLQILNFEFKIKIEKEIISIIYVLPPFSNSILLSSSSLLSLG
ncbi:hypothetical protein S245_057188 [Arachis hypogaea]